MWAFGGSAAQRQLWVREIRSQMLMIGKKDIRKNALSELSEQLVRASKAEIKLKSLILAQIERWRHALHMQVERQRGGNPGGEWRTGE